MNMAIPTRIKMKSPAIIDAQRCVGCTQCKLICPVAAIIQHRVICQVFTQKCILCGRCPGICPLGIIREDDS